MVDKEKPENLKPTPASEIRRRAREVISEGKLIELPSGIVVRVGRPSLANMLKSGKIPANLVSAAVKQMQGSTLMTQKDLQESIEVVELILLEAVKEPKLVRENPAEDEICLDDFTDEDRGFIFQYVQSGALDLKPFRSQ
jgi:hypothetical protein